MSARPVLELLLGDVVRLRRPHPCGGAEWQVDRLGADIGLRCRTCGRHVLVERRQLERRLEGFTERGDLALTAAVTAAAARDGAATRPGAPAAGGAEPVARPDPAAGG